MNLRKVLQIPFLKRVVPVNHGLGLLATVLFCLLISCGLNEKPLSLPEGITMKKLDNGFTYYLVPKGDPGKVKVMIVSKTGKLAEKPEQHGFAHMLEHTVFNGSKNFPGNSSVKAMENMGMRPGHDYNAYTSSVHTEYFMTIPENNLEYLEQCLRILKDWMFHLEIDPEVHENEKKIIIEEINRGGDIASPSLIGTPLEGQNLLGTVEGVKSVTVEQLNAFYKDNYTPGQLALIVYGRMDEKESAKLIEQLFGSVSYTSNKVNTYFDVNKQTIVSDKYKSDSWQKNTELKIAYKTIPLVENTYAAVKQRLVNNMLLQILERRMQSSDDSSINRSSTNMGSIIPGNMLYNFSLRANGEAEYKKVLQAFCTTMAQALQYGFSKAELEYYVQKKIDWYKQSQNKEGIDLYQVQTHFLKGTVPLSGKATYQLVSEILPTLTAEDFTATLKRMLAFHTTILYDGSSKACTPDFNEDYILKSLNNLDEIETQAYQFKKPQMPGAKQPVITHIEVEPGKPGVLKKKEQLAEGLHLLQYQNGTRVIFHESNRDKILIKLLAKDGLNQVAEGDRYYYKTIADAFFRAYGTYNSKEVSGVERSFGIHKKIKPANYTYEYMLDSKTENFEQALQVLNLSLTNPACPENKELADRIEMISKRKPGVDKGKEFEEQKSIEWLPAKPKSSVDETMAERLFEANKLLSTNLKNAVVFISGQLPDNAEELVAQFIASVTPSALPEKQVVKRLAILPQGVEAREFEWNNRKLARVGYLFTALPEHHLQLKDELMLEAVGQYAFIKMVETIRDKYGLIYALGMTANVQTYPADYYSLSLRYMIDPENVGLSQKVMREEVLTPISEGRISKQEVEKIKAMMRSLFVMSFYEPEQMEGRWLQWALKYDKVPSPKEINKLIESITYSELQTLMKKVVNTRAHFVSVRMPKNKK